MHWNLTLRMSVVFLIKINKVYSGFYVRRRWRRLLCSLLALDFPPSHPLFGKGRRGRRFSMLSCVTAVLSQTPIPKLAPASGDKTKSLNAIELSGNTHSATLRGSKRRGLRASCRQGHLRRPTSETHNYKCIN